MKKLILLLCIATVLPACISCGGDGEQTSDTSSTAAPSTQTTEADENAVYGGIFDSGRIIEVNVTISEADRAAMLASPAAEEYYPVTVTVDGVSGTTAGMKTRGNITYVNESGSNRYSYKIHFGKYSKGAKLNGLDELCLNNMAYDPSYIREYLTCLAFDVLEADRPLTAFARLTVNGEYAGLYLAVEAVDDSFLNRVYGDNDGNLYKADKNSTLMTYDTSTFELKNGDDTAMTELVAMIQSLSDETTQQHLDVSSVLKYIAVNAVVANEDSYLGEKAQNYYFYSQNGKLSIIPWDFNLAYGTDTSERKTGYSINTALINASVSAPYFGTSAQTRPLIAALLANETYYNEYITYVKKLADFLDTLQTVAAELKELITPAVTADTNKFYTDELFEAEFNGDAENSLLGFIKARSAAVRSQLQ